MGIWIHRLSGHVPDTFKAICKECGPVNTITQGKGRTRTCPNRAGRPQAKYRIYKKDRCERCNFLPEHTCQLDVDHIDGDHKNNDPSNLQTLCSNCHRLKTYLAKEYLLR